MRALLRKEPKKVVEWSKNGKVIPLLDFRKGVEGAKHYF